MTDRISSGAKLKIFHFISISLLVLISLPHRPVLLGELSVPQVPVVESPGVMAPPQDLYQSLPSLPEQGGVVLPVDEAGPRVRLEPHGAPEVGRPEEGERGEASD